MIKRILLVIFLLQLGLMVVAQSSEQSNRPKVGLCLSGGGAKGLAHIGLLKIIDSLGIQIDYITGTSMGSVLGALYASGYTANQIDSIAHTADWSVLLNQYSPMDEIYIDEKDEYMNYLVEIPFENKKPKITGIIEGQELLDFFSKLTRHVSGISDFSKLPIPYKCMAVDIINVEPVVMDHGNLAIAMRSSMSIPTVFKPVKWEGKLLVDGGVMVNFPVEQLRAMGADIVIGSYTGGRLLSEKEMNTIDKILVQTSNFYGIQGAQAQIPKCDIFNNLSEAMKNFSAGDFAKSEQILAAGIRISQGVLPQLDSLSKTPGIAERLQPKVTYQNTTGKIKVGQLIFDSSYTEEDMRFIRNRIPKTSFDSVSYDGIAKVVNRIYGTRNYYKVFYDLEQTSNGGYNIKVNTIKDTKIRLKAALHFDNELGAGIVLNITARNWLGNYSRLLFTVDLAEAPKYRIHYRKYIRQSNLAWNIHLYGEQTTQKSYSNTSGSIEDLYTSYYRSLNLGLNYNLSPSTLVYAGITQERTRLKPFFQTLQVVEVITHTTALTGIFQANTLNHPFFPTRGVDLYAEGKLALLPYMNLSFSDTLVGKINIDGISQPYAKTYLKFNSWLPITQKISIVNAFKVGLFFNDVVQYDSADRAKLGLQVFQGAPPTEYYFIGGVEQRSRNDYIPFAGLKEGEFTEANFLSAKIGLQYQIKPKLFITPFFNYLYMNSKVETFIEHIKDANINYRPVSDADGSDYSAMYSYGINIGFKSFVGPINLNFARSSAFNLWRGYISIGFRF